MDTPASDEKDGKEDEKHDLVDKTVDEVETATMETEETDAGEEEVVASHNQPMDLGSPLDSDPEFDLSLTEREESKKELGEEAATEDDATGETETEQSDKKEREEEKEVAEEEGKDEGSDKKESSAGAGELEGAGNRPKRLDSTFDSSYEPASEELLYEGDPETETKQEPSQEESITEEEQVTQGGGVTENAAAERREEEEGFMVEVHYKDQGGSLEDPAATAMTSAPEAEKKGGKSSLDASKTAGDSTRFVLPFFFLSLHRRGGLSCSCTPHLVPIEAHHFLIGAHY